MKFFKGFFFWKVKCYNVYLFFLLLYMWLTLSVLKTATLQWYYVTSHFVGCVFGLELPCVIGQIHTNKKFCVSKFQLYTYMLLLISNCENYFLIIIITIINPKNRTLFHNQIVSVPSRTNKIIYEFYYRN